MKGQKKEPWRIVVFILALAYIIYMWVEKDVLSIYATMPPEQALPLAVTTVAVSLLKGGALTVGILLLKWVVNKIRK